MRFPTLPEWLAWQERLHPTAIDLGLGRVSLTADRMGLLPAPFTVITVGGTNGKGSSVALLDAILRAAGYRVGRYTSPHLLRYNERIVIDGVEAADPAIVDAFAAVDAARGDTSLTYFEFGTLAAIELFRRAAVDVAVLEVGMGGRLDAVNVWEADTALVTAVDVDHADWLGADRETIGREKAGIYHAGRAAVCSDPAPPDSLQATAAAVGAPLFRLGRDFGWEPVEGGWRWWGPGRRRDALPLPALRGRSQLDNAAGVLMVLDRVAERLPVDNAQVRQGLLDVSLPGRFQVLPGPVTTILDVAHNPHAARELAANLDRLPAPGRTLAVFAALGDKDVAGVAAALVGAIDHWYVAGLDVPRGVSAAETAAALRGAGVTALSTYADFAAAHAAAAAAAQPGDRVVVFGSFFTVAAALAGTIQ